VYDAVKRAASALPPSFSREWAKPSIPRVMPNSRALRCIQGEEFADLCGADLTEASLLDADLTNANLRGAHWERIASMKNANIFGVNHAPQGFVEWAMKHGALEQGTGTGEPG
jgi:hypothetical protein